MINRVDIYQRNGLDIFVINVILLLHLMNLEIKVIFVYVYYRIRFELFRKMQLKKLLLLLDVYLIIFEETVQTTVQRICNVDLLEQNISNSKIINVQDAGFRLSIEFSISIDMYFICIGMSIVMFSLVSNRITELKACLFCKLN